jgi:hypothetical protein
MTIEGSVHILWLNLAVPSERPQFLITWRPYPASPQSGALSSVTRIGIIPLHNFLRDDIGMADSDIDGWLKQVEEHGEASIYDVILDDEALHRSGLAA